MKFTFVENSWDDYWTKLPLTIQNRKGPALFNFHNSKEDLLLPFMAPYTLDTKALAKDYLGVPSHLKGGKLYYTDYGFMTAAMFYNKKLWKEAGLTDKDFPKTWDQFRAVAKKLTKTDAKGNITQAGYNFNGKYDAMIMGLNYQRGGLLYKADKKSINFDTPTTIASTKFLVDLYNLDKVGSKDFGTDANASFGQEQTAIVYNWGWFKNYLPDNFPKLEWGVFNLPSPYSDKAPFAYDRYNGESTFGVNKLAPADQQAVAQDVVKFFVTNEDVIRKWSMMFGCFPAKNSLRADPIVIGDPLTKELSKIIDRTIWPGVIPGPIETDLKATLQEVLYNGMTVEAAVTKTQKQLERDLKNIDFTSVEDQYTYFKDLPKYAK